MVSAPRVMDETEKSAVSTLPAGKGGLHPRKPRLVPCRTTPGKSMEDRDGYDDCAAVMLPLACQCP